MTHDEIFEKFCKPALEALSKKQDETIDILKGKDGEPGLCEQVREQDKRIGDLEQTRTAGRKAVIFVVCAFVAEMAVSLWGHISSFFNLGQH